MRPEKARGLSAAVREWERVTHYINEGRGERYTNEGRGGGAESLCSANSRGCQK